MNARNRNTNTTTICACMIVKNESKYILESIRSIYNVVDEIVIIDTGSTDDTKSIIQSCISKELQKTNFNKINLYELPWSGDFADMRNKSMASSRIFPDYFLIIDGDEILDAEYTKNGPLEFRKRLGLFAAPYNDKAWFLCHRHYTDVASIINFEQCSGKKQYEKYEKGMIGYFHTFCVRLFPGTMDLRYESKVHELIEYSVFDKGIIPQYPNPAILLHHYGNLSSLRKSKNKGDTYLKLLIQKTKEEPDNWRGWFELGNEFMQNGDNMGAEEYYTNAHTRKLLSSRWSKDVSEEDHNKNIRRLVKLIAICKIRNGKYNQAEHLINKILIEEPHDPDLYMALGLVQLNKKLYIECFINLEKCLKLRPNHLIAMHTMGKAFEELNKRTEAIMWYQKMLEVVPTLTSIKHHIHKILNGK